jgi:hypothetical protein
MNGTFLAFVERKVPFITLPPAGIPPGETTLADRT